MSRGVALELPDIDEFVRVTQSMAALDAILSPEWHGRYYSFDARWGSHTHMASMRDGEEDHWFAVITPAGVAIHGLAHESPTYDPGHPKPWVFADLPEAFHESLLREPAFDTSHSTYCAWRLRGATAWSCGSPEGTSEDFYDGMSEQLGILTKGPAGYAEWAEEYFEVDVALASVVAVYEHRPITPELAARLNPEIEFDALLEDLRGIGYV